MTQKEKEIVSNFMKSGLDIFSARRMLKQLKTLLEVLQSKDIDTLTDDELMLRMKLLMLFMDKKERSEVFRYVMKVRNRKELG